MYVYTYLGASQVALVVKNPPANAGDIRDTGSIPGLGRSPWRRPWQHTPVFLPRESHGQVLRSVQQVGIKNGQRTVWEKGTRDRIRVLKMGPGNSRPLGSRALFLGATSFLFSVLASRKYLLCYDEVSLLCPRSHLPFY